MVSVEAVRKVEIFLQEKARLRQKVMISDIIEGCGLTFYTVKRIVDYLVIEKKVKVTVERRDTRGKNPTIVRWVAS